MITAESIGGRIEFDGQTISITRIHHLVKSVLGDQTLIPVGQCGSIEWAEPHWYKPGHIRFAVGGSQAGAMPTDAARDRNAVQFGKKQRKDFLAVRDMVQASIASR